jgi:hypothetical protein
MSFQRPHNNVIDPSLQQQPTLSSPNKPRELQNGGAGQSYSPVQPIQQSPTATFTGMTPTPNYYPVGRETCAL